MTCDVCIIGGGPAGTRAARLLAAEGKSVVLVESAELGGTCLNRGCIPTKMLLGAVTTRASVQALNKLRVLSGDVSLEFPAMHTRMRRFVSGTRQALSKQLTAAGITVMEGHATCLEPGLVRVDGNEGRHHVRAADIIIATGSRPAAFPGLAADHLAVLDSTDLLASSDIPDSLLIVGGGVIGLELADVYSALGSRITIVEAAPHILPAEDDDIAAEMARACKKKGQSVICGIRATSLESRDGQAVLMLENGQIFTATRALMAVGRSPNTAGLDCDKLGCTLDRRGAVMVDTYLQAAPHVYAVGDVNGRVQLAHAAEHQALYVSRLLLGQIHAPYDDGPVPACVYGSTEVMRVGLTARAAAARGKVTVSVAPLSANAIAQAHGDISGFAKAVRCDGKLVGMAAVGHDVSHLVTAAELLVLHGARHGYSQDFMYAHPTLDECLAMALDAPQRPYPAN